MLLKSLSFTNFRNFPKGKFIFNPFLTVIIGENAKGKTNLLEALYFFMNGTGFRESREEELIKFEEKESSVEGTFSQINLKIILLKKDGRVEKKYFINKVKKKHSQYLSEQTKAILFTPEQIQIITDSPDVRRGYFDKLISSYDLEYKKKLSNFENALRRRNKVLENHKDEFKLKEELEFWNEYLEKQASYISEKREDYVNYLNSHQDLDNKRFQVKYLKNSFTKERFEQIFEQEKRWRRTLIGPQKDDFQFFLNQKNIHHFGSRSEQRMVIIWLKLNEVRFYEEKNLPAGRQGQKKPIILLDDVFSEFDMQNKKLILSLIKNYQTIITTTEKEITEMIEGEKTIIEL